MAHNMSIEIVPHIGRRKGQMKYKKRREKKKDKKKIFQWGKINFKGEDSSSSVAERRTLQSNMDFEKIPGVGGI